MIIVILISLENVNTLENIMTQHHYTSTTTETAAAAVNAGTCLEDGNSLDNTFSHIGDAVKAVRVCSYC